MQELAGDSPVLIIVAVEAESSLHLHLGEILLLHSEEGNVPSASALVEEGL